MTNKKYYICVTPFFPSPGNWRGAYVLDQVKAIQRNSEYEVVVFMGGGKADADYEIDGIKVYRYHTRELPSNILNGFFNGYNSRSFMKRVMEVGINPNDVAFVHCHVSMRAVCGLALKKLNPAIKVLLQHHDLDPFNLRSGVLLRNNRFNIRYRAKKAIGLYNKVDLHICISEACRDSLLQFPNPREWEVYDDCIRSLKLCKGLPSIHPKGTYVLYNGVDTTLFNRKDSSSGSKCSNLFRIGCISNFQELKNHVTLIKAFEILHKKGYNNIVLSLLGTGETREECETYLRNSKINPLTSEALKPLTLYDFVEWPSEVTHDKLPDYYRSLDLFVLPSYFEGFGCVYTEAVACGVPFMGCVNQGYSEYVADKERWLIEPKDYEQLAKLIERYYLSGSNGSRVQELCHPFDINILIKDFLDYIKKL